HCERAGEAPRHVGDADGQALAAATCRTRSRQHATARGNVMSLKYSNTPQLIYGDQQQRSPATNWRSRFPQEAQPIASAPVNSASPYWVFEPDGSGYLALYHQGKFQILREEEDSKTGARSLCMNGSAVANAVAWMPAK